MRLGYIPIGELAIATGGPTNPVGIAVTIAAGAAMVISRFLKIGVGRTEADYLTHPETGAQTHAGLAMDAVTSEFWNHPEMWTPDHIDAVVSALEKIGMDFEVYALQFPRAGPGGIATIWYWINRAIVDIWGVTPRSTIEPLLTEATPHSFPPITPGSVYLDTPSYQTANIGGLGLLMFLGFVLRRKR